MNLLKPSFLYIAFLTSINLFSQVPFKGDFILGDTAQTHKLTTAKGDIFTGRVTGFEKSSLYFLYRNSNLVFKLEEIKLIEVINKNAPNNIEPPNLPLNNTEKKMTEEEAENYIWHFDYKISTTNTGEHLGKLTKLNEYNAALNKNSKKTDLINYQEIVEITLIGKRITSNPNQLTEYHRLITTKGDSFTGQLLSFNQKELVFLLKSGSELTILKEEFESIILVKNGAGNTIDLIAQNRKHEYNQQRLFLSPSALMMKKGVNEFRSNMILYNTIDHGVSDNFTIGAGLFTVLVGNALTGKIKFGASLTDFVHVAAGAQGAFAFSTFGDGVSVGMFYGSVAIGTNDRFINVSAGRGKSTDDDEGTTGFTLGGSFRMNENWRVMVEYLHFQEPYYSYYNYNRQNNIFGTIGLSWFKYQHQIDFGIFVGNDYDTPRGVPVAAYNFRF